MNERAGADEFAMLARELATQPTLEATLQRIVERAVSTVEGAEFASITIKHGQRNYKTVAFTDPLPVQVDAIQYQTGEGPCVDALEDHHVFLSDDVTVDERWPRFGARAASLTDVVSMMSHRLYIENTDTIGALNLYSRQAAAFAPLDLSVLDILATHCAIALATAADRDQNSHLRNALESNRDIGIAIGILMSLRLVTKEQAFDLLRIASQHGHRKLHDIALEVAETGALPGVNASSARRDGVRPGRSVAAAGN